MNLSDYFDEEEKRRVAALKPLEPETENQRIAREKRQEEFAEAMKNQIEDDEDEERDDDEEIPN